MQHYFTGICSKRLLFFVQILYDFRNNNFNSFEQKTFLYNPEETDFPKY